MHKPNCSMFTAILLSIFMLPASVFSEKAKPLSAMSDKEAYKEAVAALSAGRPEDALEAIKYAMAKKKKPEYQQKQAEILTALSDRESDKGEQACSKMQFDICDQQISKAKSFAETDRLKKLQQSYTTAVAKLRDQRNNALALGDSGNPESGLTALKELEKFPYIFPDMKKDTAYLTDRLIQKLLSEGQSFVDARNWDGAESRFNRVLSISDKNENALAGKANCIRGREAYQHFAEAQSRAKALDFQEAYRFVQTAIKKFPEGKELEQGKNQIIDNWVNYLLKGLPDLLENPNDLQKTRNAYLNLISIRGFRPSNAEVPKFLPAAERDFAANALIRAKELTEILDYSRIGTAYALKLTAQQLMPQAVRQEELKDLLTIFARKRASQLVFSVEDLSTSSPEFIQTVRNRARNRMDSFAYPDLRIRTVDDYLKSPNEDAQFQDLRPDGKSSTAELRIAVTKWESVRNSSEKPVTVKSEYISGKRKIPNAEYGRLKEELSAMRKSLDNPKRNKNKPVTPEGWTEATYSQKLEEFRRLDPEKEEDVVSPYNYQKIEHSQHTTVEIQVTFRDYFSKESIASKTIRFHDERSATEIAGVKETDVSHAENSPVRLTSPQDVLEKAQRAALEDLDQAIAQILPVYVNRFYNEAEKAMKAKKLEDAVEAYLCHWAFMRGKLDAEQLDRISEVVRQETAFDLKRNGEALYRAVSSAP
jgi:outer membrane protein assembly factor BamD (BamD/ComL family)